MFDNSNIQQKIRVRKKGLSEFSNLNIDIVLEMYAGAGILSKFWSQIANKLICVEKDKSKLDNIIYENVEKYNTDNNSLAIINISKDIQIIDCDAYGKVTNQLKILLDIATTDKLIFFTDGTLKQEMKTKQKFFDEEMKKLNADKIYYEKAIGGNVYYGYIFKKLK